jgi:hypothetical protein
VLAEVCKEVRVCMEEQRAEHGYSGRGAFFESVGGGYVDYGAFRKYVKETRND